MKILVIAYCNGNLGDDLFIYELCNRYPNHTFYLVGNEQYSGLFAECKNLHYIDQNKKTWRYYAKVRNTIRKVMHNKPDSRMTTIRLRLKKTCDLVVMIGGSVFIQGENWKAELESRKRLLPGRTVLLGCNYRLANSEEYHKSYVDLLGRVEDICFRDQASYEQFKELPNARFASDILFGVDDRNCKTEDYYILSVIDVTKKVNKQEYADMYYKRMAECADLLQKQGQKVILFSFCEAEGDMAGIASVQSYMKETGNVEVLNHKNIRQSLDCLKHCKGIITARFHGMVLGIQFKKEVYPIIYSDKTTQVLKDIAFSGKYSMIPELEAISAEEICAQLHAGYQVREDRNPEEQFKALDRILK